MSAALALAFVVAGSFDRFAVDASVMALLLAMMAYVSARLISGKDRLQFTTTYAEVSAFPVSRGAVVVVLGFNFFPAVLFLLPLLAVRDVLDTQGPSNPGPLLPLLVFVAGGWCLFGVVFQLVRIPKTGRWYGA